MSLIDELRPVSVRPRLQRKRRLLAWIPLALLGVLAIGTLAYRDSYQPLEVGSSFGGDDKLIRLNDGLAETRMRITAAGSPVKISISIENRGRFGVRVLAVGDAADDADPVDLSVRATGLNTGKASERSCCDANAEPFHAFWLAPGKERRIELTLTSKPCAANESGVDEQFDSVAVRYSFLGATRQTFVPLSSGEPIVRACPDSALPLRQSTSTALTELAPSGFDFGVPVGWNATPPENGGGPSSVATWSQPQGQGEVTYEQNGGSAGMLYDDHDNIRVAGAKDATGCRLSAFSDLGGGAFAYTCVARQGFLRKGILRIASLASGGGYERIEIYSRDKALVAQFLASVKV